MSPEKLMHGERDKPEPLLIETRLIAMPSARAPVTSDRSTATFTCIVFAAAFARKPGGAVSAGANNPKFTSGATAICSR